MSFAAILSVTPAGRVGKFREFETLTEAQAHAAGYPGAFAVETPAAPWNYWRIDPVAETVTIDDAEYVAEAAATAAEKQRLDAIRADTRRQELLDRLRSATPVQISDYVDANVTDLASARTMLKRIILILAALE